MEGVDSEAENLQQAGIIRVEHNPRLEKKKISNSEKLKLIKLGPFQPKINFPKKTRKFNLRV
jgi:hypothetical protein